MRLISACWFVAAFYLIFLSNGSEGKEDWPYCKNFESAKGYPTGKDYSENLIIQKHTFKYR
jgi:hypothetical protein